MNMKRFDVVVFGATGTVGVAIAELFVRSKRPISWALAARNETKLQALHTKLEEDTKGSCECGLIIADCSDVESMRTMTSQARVILNTAGPFSKYGESVIQACIETGTHYVDITGEVSWVCTMRERYEKKAQEANVCITNFGGYDCIPPEICMGLANDALGQSHILKSAETLIEAKNMSNSGIPRGTALTFFDFAGSPLRFFKSLKDSFQYVPVSERAAALKSFFLWTLPKWSSYAGGFTLPNIMGLINIPVIHRSASQLGFGGLTFYDRMPLPKPASNLLTGYGLLAVVAFYSFTPILVTLAWLGCMIFGDRIEKMLMARTIEGNPKAICDFTLVGRGSTPEGTGSKDVRVHLVIPGDPGIFCTGLLSQETAIGMADKAKLNSLPSGFHTPVEALGSVFLAERFKSAGIHVEVSSGGKAVPLASIKEAPTRKAA
mmetsp:Transcript_17011/g.23799  ORF Transcript_17011/g.23799 Transcript_17011/m.23799 type:complete len:435 (-) Transcript_17011:127-1431(-)|eukprot:CAMPEP_0184477938 /NCGR_PEP_ID=MMETSP0113_2-20130426/80_1 /TAXON_ID=91329 /ORGANISM="Norrisiella sphaerica, Strain BC52" /LENGTH=434 /DNA_ID=CAMNT_0026855555 /DNA_START=36 /DNA_END=1340 /DNA_ORIENTATION=-